MTFILSSGLEGWEGGRSGLSRGALGVHLCTFWKSPAINQMLLQIGSKDTDHFFHALGKNQFGNLYVPGDLSEDVHPVFQ